MVNKKDRVIYRRGGPLDGENIEYFGILIQSGYEQEVPTGGGKYVWQGEKDANSDRIIVWVPDDGQQG